MGRAWDKSLKRSVVVKKMIKLRSEGQVIGNYRLYMLREINIMRRLGDHPNLCKFYYALEDADAVYLVMDDCGDMDLDQYLSVERKGAPVPQEEAAYYIKQALDALSYIHGRYISHLDVKLQNLLLDSLHRVKLIDFGCSMYNQSVDFEDFGTPGYKSYEMVNGKGFDTQEFDVWGVGVSAYLLVTGKYPFSQQDTRREKEWERKLRDFDYLKLTDGNEGGYLEEFKDFIDVIFVPEKIRPTIKDLLIHPWIRKAQFVPSKIQRSSHHSKSQK